MSENTQLPGAGEEHQEHIHMCISNVIAFDVR